MVALSNFSAKLRPRFAYQWPEDNVKMYFAYQWPEDNVKANFYQNIPFGSRVMSIFTN